jgi:diguanylate cyclase (GGDEF)-like protein
MPLLLRLLLPLALLVLSMSSVRMALLWRDEVLAGALQTQRFVADFEHLYGPRIAELQAFGEQARLQELLQRSVADDGPLARLQWHSRAGDELQAQARPVALRVPAWVKSLQQIEHMPNALQDSSHSLVLAYQGLPTGTLTVTLTAAPEINRIWQAVRLQLWAVASLLGVLLLLIPVVLLSSLRGLTQLSRAALLLPGQPELRIQPTGAREVQQLALAFNAMADSLQQARLQTQEQLVQTTWVAHHDTLTGLPNRALLADRLQQALRRCERHHETLGLCFIDLDHFKPINDQHGHSVGDLVLITAAKRMQAELRDTDTLARVGGDEFVMLLTSLQQPQEAQAIVERVLASLRLPIEIQDLVAHISGSAGLTLQGPLDSGAAAPEADLLLRQADQAMYQAKQAGRDCIRLWQSDVLSDQQQCSERLMLAVQQGELHLFYQPKVHLVSGEVVGLEALIRWQHPERGLLLPLEFLPQVEHTPTIVTLGDWVMNTALAQMEAWAQDGTGWPVSINVAPRQLMAPGFMANLGLALLRCPHVKAHWLTLEILETSSLGNLALVSATVRDAQSLGVHCSLDDFGTGFSSLSYLKELPVHEIKIDQTFVHNMLDDPGDLALVEGVISLAQVFGRHLVAEGMETAEHGVLLLRLGCEVAQGWCIARPMPAQAVLPWVRHYRSDPLWSQWGSVKWDLNDMALLLAKHDHIQWVDDLIADQGGSTPHRLTDEMALPADCRFGHWYEGHGRQTYRRLSAFRAIAPVHREVHRLGLEVIRLRQTGRPELAKSAAGRLLFCRSQLLQHIDHLHREVLAQQRV